jgi:uncharacterized membrane protein
MVTDQAAPPRSISGLFAAVPSIVGVVVAFVVAVVQYAAIDDGTTKSLSGLDSFLGFPNVGISIVFFSIFVALFLGLTAGARYRHGLWVGAIVVAGLGTIFQLLAIVFNFSWVAVVLLVAAIATLLFTILGCREAKRDGTAAQVARSDRTFVFGVVLVVAGLAGLTAAYNLSVDKVTAILSPASKLNCSFSLVVECGTNLKSWQGSLFGFPNPLIGLGGFAVVLVIGIATLLGVSYRRWWWIAFNAAVIGAFAFITFLIYSSVYVIGTLCVWCALVWIVTIPTFWITTIGNLKNGNLKVGPRATAFFRGAYTWVPLITLLCYVVIFLIYETHLDLLANL